MPSRSKETALNSQGSEIHHHIHHHYNHTHIHYANEVKQNVHHHHQPNVELQVFKN